MYTNIGCYSVKIHLGPPIVKKDAYQLAEHLGIHLAEHGGTASYSWLIWPGLLIVALIIGWVFLKVRRNRK